ncbi:hypothetical protein NM688_g2693 [Phlebia brevispora]|uniref:Uncharacterized protein n=1 Tax=Phlebia brevispora TaxID=194682 RepID=A0ACC1T843_9APHY|nr:hypothetical protein NM688_g2693 [Phlebia brevispora]
MASGSSDNKPSQLVWYITGTSSGFGKRLVPLLLERGDKVIATARTLSKIEDFPPSKNLRIQQLDVTDGAQAIKHKIDEAVQWFGRIDVLVNNAGTPLQSVIEEGGSDQFRKQYEVNVFGQLDVTTAVLAHMRPRRSGTIVMMCSRLSWWPVNPCSGLYASSKAALRGPSCDLSMEVSRAHEPLSPL